MHKIVYLTKGCLTLNKLVKYEELPVEFHYSVAKFLPPIDLKHCGQAMQGLREVYSVESWRNTIVVKDYEKSPESPFFDTIDIKDIGDIHEPYIEHLSLSILSRAVPLSIFFNARFHRWFLPKGIRKLDFRPNVSFQTIFEVYGMDVIKDFHINYPRLSRIYFSIDATFIRKLPKVLDFMEILDKYDRGPLDLFINLYSFKPGYRDPPVDFKRYFSPVMEYAGCLRKLEIHLAEQFRYDIQFPKFISLEELIIFGVRMIPEIILLKLFYTVAEFSPFLKRVESLHTPDNIKAISLLPETLKYCAIDYDPAKGKLFRSEVISEEDKKLFAQYYKNKKSINVLPQINSLCLIGKNKDEYELFTLPNMFKLHAKYKITEIIPMSKYFHFDPQKITRLEFSYPVTNCKILFEFAHELSQFVNVKYLYLTPEEGSNSRDDDTSKLIQTLQRCIKVLKKFTKPAHYTVNRLDGVAYRLDGIPHEEDIVQGPKTKEEQLPDEDFGDQEMEVEKDEIGDLIKRLECLTQEEQMDWHAKADEETLDLIVKRSSENSMPLYYTQKYTKGNRCANFEEWKKVRMERIFKILDMRRKEIAEAYLEEQEEEKKSIYAMPGPIEEYDSRYMKRLVESILDPDSAAQYHKFNKLEYFSFQSMFQTLTRFQHLEYLKVRNHFGVDAFPYFNNLAEGPTPKTLKEVFYHCRMVSNPIPLEYKKYIRRPMDNVSILDVAAFRKSYGCWTHLISKLTDNMMQEDVVDTYRIQYSGTHYILTDDDEPEFCGWIT